ncbi:DUF6270 domain-containing protein [Paenarthrobacter sp. YJN-5]|uniref:DUF6270 domain-containing protein n=1 Tax=Paenarthrobacter sp. YJN-5 TaxID=2735316 RepID=UPI001877BC01|nr:DUF6270 domain-containing protein [Paenarthrobacter sp. YJN-5]QOT16062.1 hypothetical protein HMI59_05275 [Paenarthrobacter sp. YJN-5]
MPGMFIYGSCVSRDTKPYLGDDWTISDYVARQGMISAASPRAVLRGESALKSKFQNQCVRNDIRSTLFSAIEAATPKTDVFVLDLVDERLGVYDLGNGTYVTQTWELEESKLLQQQQTKPRLIPFASDEHYQLWTKAADVVLERIKATGRPLIVLSPEWSETADNGQEKLQYRGYFSSTWNKLYAPYFDHLRSRGCNVLSVGQDTVKAAAGHQWGLAPYHYVDAVYHRMRDAITAAVK